MTTKRTQKIKINITPEWLNSFTEEELLQDPAAGNIPFALFTVAEPTRSPQTVELKQGKPTTPTTTIK
jgi:hypothetical protein